MAREFQKLTSPTYKKLILLLLCSNDISYYFCLGVQTFFEKNCRYKTK
jgi:hypothetical protein